MKKLPDPQEAATLALDPKTHADTLTQLANLFGAEIKELVLQNPNISKELLFSLGAKRPDLFLKNPALKLLVLEGSALESINEELWYKLSDQEIPDWLYAFLLQHPDPFRCNVLIQSAKFPAARLIELATHRDVEIRRTVAWHPNATPETLALSAADPEPGVRAQVARNDLPKEIEQKLAKDKDIEVRCSIAQITKDPELHKLFSIDKSGRVQGSLAANPSITPERRDQLCNKYAEFVASNPNADQELLRKLAATNKNDINVLVQIAQHKNTPIDILIQLADHKGKNVRITVANNERAPDEAIETLAQDPEKEVRASIGRAPLSALLLLAKDKEPSLRADLLRRKDLPAEVLAILYKDRSVSVKIGLCEHEKTPADVLALCVSEKEIWTRINAAAHRNTPKALLETLAKDPAPQVRASAASNPNASLRLLEEFSRDTADEVRGACAQNPGTPDDLIEALSKDSSEEVRLAVAGRPTLSRAIIEALCFDASVNVQSTIHQRW